MKVRTRKKHGMFQIIVDDENINRMYDRTQADPIVLASLSHWDKSGFWCLEDIRLFTHANGRLLLGSSTIQSHHPSSSQEHNALVKQLSNYIKKKDIITWSSFEGIVYPGDKTEEVKDKLGVPKTGEYCWSLNAGQEQLDSLLKFWENYNENDLENIAIENPHKQISEMMFFAQYLAHGEQPPKNKHKLK